MSYLIHLRQFEGPLGLLLYLIRKEEMDIFDINVGEITRQYLDYIRMMKELDLEVAGEFVAMAATLIHIKSRMLLPQYNEEGEVVEQEDPRKELVQKLLEYQRYQEVAKSLYERPLLNRDVFTRGIRENFAEDDFGEIITEEDGLFSLISSYRKAVRKAQRMVHKVRPKVQSIATRVMELKDHLRVGVRTLLGDLVRVGGGPQRAQLLITFLSMLELGRMGYVSLFQNEVYGDIYIEPKRAVEGNVLERVQEFDSGDAEAIARKLINQAEDDQAAHFEEISEERAVEVEQMSLLADSLTPSMLGEGPDQIAERDFAPSDIASDEEILAAEAELGSLSEEPVLAISTSDEVTNGIDADASEAVQIADHSDFESHDRNDDIDSGEGMAEV